MDKLYIDKEISWICIRVYPNKSRPWFRRDTLSFTRKGSIESFLKDSMTTWDEAKKYGWVCKKVSVEITVLN